MTLYVRIGYAQGEPFPDVQVIGEDGEGTSFDKSTNEQGYVKISGSPGNWSFTASSSNARYADKTWAQEINETGTRNAFLLLEPCDPTHTPIEMKQAARYALAAGFEESNAARIVAIAWAESGGNPFNCNIKGNDPADSWDRGILQINDDVWWEECDDECAFDPARAFQVAYEHISRKGTRFKDWVTYWKPCADGSSGSDPCYTKFMDDAQQAVTQAEQRRRSPSISLVLDRTGSMSGDRISNAKTAAGQFVQQLPIPNNLGIVSYNTSAEIVYPLQELASERDKVRAQIEIGKITAGGDTSIATGLQEAVTQVGNEGSIVLLSDGLENTRPCVDTVLPDIPKDVDVFTIAFGPDETEDGDCGSVRGRRLLKRIAFKTAEGSGQNRFFVWRRQGDLSAIFNQIASELTGQQVVLSQSQTIAQGATDQLSAVIDPSMQSANFMVGWPGSDLDLTLTTPDGDRIDQEAAKSDPLITFQSTETFESYEVQSPSSGAWQLEVEAIDVPSEGEPYTATVAGPANLTFDVQFDQATYTPNEPIEISARVMNQGTAVTDTTVEAEVTDSGGDTTTISLLDDGQHADQTSNDGIYGNTYTETANDGSYTFEFHASGSVRGTEFSRTTRRSIQIGAPIGTITGTIAYEGKQDGPIYVQAWTDDPDMEGRPDFQDTLAQPGSYTLERLPDATYFVRAYRDSDDDGKPDRIEPYGSRSQTPSQSIVVNGGETVSQVDMTLFEIPLAAIAQHVDGCPKGIQQPLYVICREEMKFATWLYYTNQSVPRTGGEILDRSQLREMTSYYISGTQVNHPPGEVSSQAIEAELAELLEEHRPRPFSLSRVLLTPNPIPTDSPANFSVVGTGIKSLQVNIYDLSGRTIFSSDRVTGNTFTWYLQDDHGNVVANGVYLYLVTVRGAQGQVVRSEVKKLVVLR